MNQQNHHVLFVVNTYPPRLGGLENHVASLARQLVADGHRATVVTLFDEPGRAHEHGVTVVRLRGHLSIGGVISLPAPGVTRRITRGLTHAGVTAVSTHTRFFPMSFAGWRVARRLGVPHVHTEHGSAHVRGASRFVGLASRLVDLTIGRAVLRGADVVLAVSENVTAFVRRLAGVESTLFYNAIDAPPAEERESERVARFVFVGRLVAGKGWQDVLLAASMLRSRLPDASFTVELLGDGPQRDEVQVRISELGLQAIATARGHVSSSQVHASLRGAVLVNPTRLAEGFQTTLLEALASGGQVVTFPAPGVERLVADGAPIRVADRSTVQELADLMQQSLVAPLEPFPKERLVDWTWPERARQFAGLLDGMPRRGSRAVGT